jgi:hypothetical protein
MLLLGVVNTGTIAGLDGNGVRGCLVRFAEGEHIFS